MFKKQFKVSMLFLASKAALTNLLCPFLQEHPLIPPIKVDNTPTQISYF